MKKIKTVDELISAFKQKTAETSYLEILKNVDIPLREYEKYYTWNRERNTRNCLVKTEDFELLLICYEKGQQTPIHDFGNNQAWINTIHGKLREERFELDKAGKGLIQLSSTTLGTNEYSFMSRIGIHRYTNTYEARTISLNLYVNPIVRWTQYDENGNSSEVVVSHDSVYI